MRLKKRGILISLRRDEGVEPKLEGPPVGRGREMCGFMAGDERQWAEGRRVVGEAMRRQVVTNCVYAWWLSNVTANVSLP